MNEIKAIPTSYGDTVFRSRLEARWAIFYDTLWIRWQYEPAFDVVEAGLRRLAYRPDFHLPDLDYWIEIKPQVPEPHSVALTKAAGWANDNGNLYIFFALQPPPAGTSAWRFGDSEDGVAVLSKWHCWTECRVCGAIDITQHGAPPELCLGRCYTRAALDAVDERSGDDPDATDAYYSNRSSRLLAAYRTAQQARFSDTPQAQRAYSRHFADERAGHYRAAALNTYATKKYGPDWRDLYDDDRIWREFDDWIAREHGFEA